MLGDDILHFRWLERHVPRPLSKSAGSVDRLDPFTQGVALGLVLRAVCSLDLKREHFAAGQPDKEVWNIPTTRAGPHVLDLKTKMIVLRVGDHIISALEDIRCVTLPRGIADKMADVRFGRREAGLGSILGAHLPGSADGVFFVEDGGKALRVLLGYVTYDVLDNEVDVQRNQDPAPQRVRVKQ